MHVHLHVTDILGWEHIVSDDAMSLGRLLGRYVALCSREVIAASLTAPPGRRCYYCQHSTLI